MDLITIKSGTGKIGEIKAHIFFECPTYIVYVDAETDNEVTLFRSRIEQIVRGE
jgi:hypothetical protein